MTDGGGADPSAKIEAVEDPALRKMRESRALNDGVIAALFVGLLGVGSGVSTMIAILGDTQGAATTATTLCASVAALVAGLGGYRKRLALRGATALIGAGIALALVGPVVAAVGLAVANRSPRLSTADRAPLVRQASMLRHPSLGFELPDPGADFVQTALDPEQRAQMGVGAHGVQFKRGDKNTDKLVVVLRVGIDSPSAFRDYLGGVKDSLGRTGFVITREVHDENGLGAALDLEIVGLRGHLRTLVLTAGDRAVLVSASGFGARQGRPRPAFIGSSAARADRLARAISHENRMFPPHLCPMVAAHG
jgi:hypothetical protein